MAAHFLPEASAVAHHALGQLSPLEPALAVHRTQRLFTGGDKVLVLSLTWGQNAQQQQQQQQDQRRRITDHNLNPKLI
jgi:hypothetical protein